MLAVYLIFSYLLGAIPFGYIITRKFAGIDILKHGSGNIGSTNVKRVAGRKWSALTQVLDVLKGFIAVLLFMVLKRANILDAGENFIFLVAFTSIVGHNYTVFLKFKGGKGVNTTLGASVLVAPIPVLAGVVVFHIVKWVFKFVSLGSILIAITLPLTGIIVYGISNQFYYLLATGALMIFQHRSNIHRLLTGQESKSP